MESNVSRHFKPFDKFPRFTVCASKTLSFKGLCHLEADYLVSHLAAQGYAATLVPDHKAAPRATAMPLESFVEALHDTHWRAVESAHALGAPAAPVS